MSSTKLTTKGQMTLPKDVRDDLGLKPGDRVEFVKSKRGYVLKPKNVRAVDLAGVLGVPPAGQGTAVEQMDEAVAHAVSERFEQKIK